MVREQGLVTLLIYSNVWLDPEVAWAQRRTHLLLSVLRVVSCRMLLSRSCWSCCQISWSHFDQFRRFINSSFSHALLNQIWSYFAVWELSVLILLICCHEFIQFIILLFGVGHELTSRSVSNFFIYDGSCSIDLVFMTRIFLLHLFDVFILIWNWRRELI